MKNKFYKLAALFVAGAFATQVGAQTDVTSTYLTNADFSEGTPAEVGICTYAKDMTNNGTTHSQLLGVEGWDIPANGDARAGGLIALGSDTWLGGPGYIAPATDSDANTSGNLLGVVAVWDAVAQYTQDVTFPAGDYTLVVPVYNSVGGNNAVQKNLIGFITDGGTEYLSTTTSYPVNTWKYDFITFTLTEETSGKISLGYDGKNAGSGSNQHLFISAISLFNGTVDAESYAAAKEAARNAKELASNKEKLQGSCYATPSADLLVNGSFDTANSGWTLTSMQYQQNNERPTRYVEKWSGSSLSGLGSATQTIKNLPAGAYLLKGVAHAVSGDITGVTLSVNDVSVDVSGAWKDYEILYNHETDGDITVIFSYNATNANWVGVDEFSLVYGGEYDSYCSDLWNYAKEAATTTLNDTNYINVIGTEKAALQAEIDKAEPTTADDYIAATPALTTATEAFIAAKTNYDALVDEIAKAKGWDIANADSYAATAESTAATALANRQVLNVAIYNVASAAYSNEFELTEWTGEIGTASGQHWDGTSATSYYDTNGTNITRSLSKTATLPPGTFVFKAAGRSSAAATMSLDVNGQIVKFYAKGDTGYGIKMDGSADFAAYQDTVYANNNAGRGWEWEFVKFTLDEQTEVTLTATITTTGWAWGSFANVSLWMDDATYTNMLINAAKDDLYAAIKNTPTDVNVGNGAFQRSADSYSEVEIALVSANEVYDDENAQVNALITATEALEAAINAYKNAALNAPAADQKFNLVLKFAGWDYDGKAVTYIEGGRTDHGLYNIQYAAAPNANYAQAFTFTPVEGQTNCYTLSMTDVDGNERYICTSVPYSGNTSQIRTTTTAADALVVKVIASSTVEGIYNLYNTAANNYIGSQDEGMYTVNSHIDFNIVEAEQAEVTLTVTEAGWATLMLPFNADIPEGLTVYSCAEVGEDNVLTLTEVEKIAANTPYVVESEAAEYEFAGYGLAKQDTYTDGIFTGTYAEMTAIIGSYVLQTQNDYTAFYIVGESIQPTVGANRCYITPSTSSAPMFSLERGEGTTGIDNAAMTEAQAPVIYDLAGRRVEKLGKGIFIMNGKKVIVK